MGSPLGKLFLKFATSKLNQMNTRIADCLSRLTDEQIWLRGSGSENAAGNLVLHLTGNVRQWILSGVGGQTDARDRDGEFAARGTVTGAELAAQLRRVMDEALAVIGNLSDDELARTIRVQGYEVPVLEAVGHVTEHFSHHTGQILFITKALTGADLGYYRHLAKASAAHREKTP